MLETHETNGGKSLLLELAPLALLLTAGARFLWASFSLPLDWYPRERPVVSATLALLLIATAALMVFPRRARYAAALGLGLFLAGLLMVDVVHFRFYRDFPSLADATSLGQIGLGLASALGELKLSDALLGLDLVAAVVLAPAYWRACRRTPPLLRARGRGVAAAVAIVAAVLTAAPALEVITHDREEIYAYAYTRQQVVAGIGLLPWHLYDVAVQVAFPVRSRWATTRTDVDDVRRALAARHRDLGPPSALFGVAEGRNLIVVQVESLQAFAIGLEAGTGRVAPTLESLARESLSFVRFYDQTHMGTTSDAELAAFQSLHPLPAGSVATRYSANSFHALPAILADRGYRTLSIVGARGDDWNMRHVHPRLGFERSLFADAFPTLERFGPGVADGALLPRVASLLEHEAEPFVAYVMTVSTHHPYRLPLDHRALGLNEDSIAEHYLESVHYVDRALGDFLAGLRRSGLLERSVLAVYGDHHGYLARPASLSERLGIDPDDEGAQWEAERRLPFLVRLPHAQAAGPRDTLAGHLDIAPTLLALLGVSPETLPGLGRDLTREAADPMVVLRNGGFVVPEATCVRPPLEAAGQACFSVDPAHPLSRERLRERAQAALEQLRVSDQIINGNLIPELVAAGREQP